MEFPVGWVTWVGRVSRVGGVSRIGGADEETMVVGVHRVDGVLRVG